MVILFETASYRNQLIVMSLNETQYIFVYTSFYFTVIVRVTMHLVNTGGPGSFSGEYNG